MAGLIILLLGVDSFKPTPSVVFYLVLASFLYFLANALRVVSLKYTDVSIVSVIGQLSLVSAALVSFLTGRDVFNPILGLGIMVVVIGNTLLVYKQGILKRLKADKYLFMAIIGALALGLAGVSYDVVKNEVPTLLALLIIGVLMAIFLLPLNNVNQKTISWEIKLHGKILLPMGVLWFASGSAVLLSINVFGVVAGTVVASISLLTTVLSGIIWLKERDSIARKLTAGLIVSIGTLMVVLDDYWLSLIDIN